MNTTGSPSRLSALPAGTDAWARISASMAGRTPAVFLDYDGTLSPIVDNPAAATLPSGTRETLRRLADRVPVAVLSGRDLDDLRPRVGLDGLWYAGSHGFEWAGPCGERHRHADAVAALDALDAAEREMQRQLDAMPGTLVQRTRFSVAAHYRVVPERAEDVAAAAGLVAGQHPGRLRVAHGRMVVELRPDVDWGKGAALRVLVGEMGVADRLLIYAGDDLTDEDALSVIHEDGLGIVVRSGEHGDRESWAHVAVDSPAELCSVLERVATTVRGGRV